MKTNLIIVEGLPGSGKSTTAAMIAGELQKQGQTVLCFDEGEEHPADYKDYDFPDFETEREKILEKWRGFVRSSDRDAVYVFNCVFLQNPMCETMMRFDMGYERSHAYIAEIAEIIRPLRPVIVYIDRPDIRASVDRVLDERGKEWLDAVIGYHTGQGYGRRKGLSGYDGYMECLAERKRRELDILRSLDIEYYTVSEDLTPVKLEELCAKLWDGVKFRNFREQDHDSLFDFLVGLNSSDKRSINWNHARFEWMYRHPEFDKSLIDSIGLWTCGERIVGAAIYDMYFGEAFCGALKGYGHLYPEMIGYAYNNMCDDSGLAISVNDGDTEKKAALTDAGFQPVEQYETVMKHSLNGLPDVSLPAGFEITELDAAAQAYDLQWLLWQGFGHGNDRAEFESQAEISPLTRKNFDPRLSIAAVSETGEKAAYCCLWYDDRTDYAYIEPLCTLPQYRGKGLAKAILFEAMDRASALGAETAYVISDMEFYKKLGFEEFQHYTFYRKPPKGGER
ncbi:Predicted N-acetyltransferase YhbS [Ruminococcaceae bacterium FB2012]|nr:Predicted N-acetyltransferase YhbS [Ruminococcaceae bacterium FB2012]